MKYLVILAGVFYTMSGWSFGIGEGSFVGQGLWNSGQQSGSYEVQTLVEGLTISSEYQLADGSTKKWAFLMEPGSGNFFTVRSQGANIGSGYCLSKALVCHYEINVGKITIEETLTTMGDQLYRFGSKSENGKQLVMWQESAQRK